MGHISPWLEIAAVWSFQQNCASAWGWAPGRHRDSLDVSGLDRFDCTFTAGQPSRLTTRTIVAASLPYFDESNGNTRSERQCPSAGVFVNAAVFVNVLALLSRFSRR